MNKKNNNGQRSPARCSSGQDVLRLAFIALIYFATARLSLSFVFQPEGIAAIWPPAGLFLSSILLTRRNLRPWLVGVLFITDLIAEVLTGTPLLVSIVYSFAVTGDAVLSSWLLLRFVGDPIAFARVREVLGFLALAVILSNGLMSLVAAAASALLPGASFWISWKWWLASDGIGNLLVTPFILGWASVAKTGWGTWNPKRVLEGAVLFILLALLNHIAFGHMSEHGQFSLLLTYLTFPFLLWAALRFGVCGVSSALLILAAIAIRSTVAGRDANIPDSLNAVIVVQLYLAIMAVPALFLAAVVTERTQAALRVADALNFNQTVLHTSPVGIAVFKASGPCVSANEAIARILVSTREQVLRYNFRQLESWKRSGMLDAAEAAMAAQAERNLEAEFVTTVGEKVWLSCRFAPFHYEGESHLLLIVGDITERKRAEEALRGKNEEIERFTYSASHDLRSPLVTIQTFLGHLERDLAKEDNQRVKEDWGYLRTAADKMVRLLDELLSLSRIGRKMNPLEEMPLHVVVKEALDLVAGRIAQRETKVEVTQEPVVLYGDRPRLVELFQNLVDNAVKFMGDQPSPHVEIGVELAGGEVVMFVRDNGMGIDPQYQPKLFELFEKFDSGTEGTGIGLAQVKRIVEVHGGRIWAESKGVGKGATFRFTLAKTQRQPAATVTAGIMPPGA